MSEDVKKALEDVSALVAIVAKDTGALVMSDPAEDSVGSTLEGDLEMTFGHVRRAHAALSTLEAALSAAEPVAWRIVVKLDSGSTTWKVVEHEHQARKESKSWEKMCAAEIHPLYAAPTAPSVAITNAFMRGANYIANNLMMLDSPDLVMSTAKAATEYALSAQVQGVAEYERREQVCKETAMSQWERSLKRPDLSEKDRMIGAIEAYKRQAFAFAFLPAAPAKQEG